MPYPEAQTYIEYAQNHAYRSDLGYVVMPVAQRTPAWRRIRLHGGLAFREVRWRAARAGLPPIVPAAEDVGTDLILSSTFVPHLPTPNPDQGGYNWTIEGTYVYLQGNPRTPGVDAFPTGAFPFGIAPNDAIAQSMGVGPVDQAELDMDDVTESVNPSNELVVNLGEEAISSSEYYKWPLTSFPPAFTLNSFGE